MRVERFGDLFGQSLLKLRAASEHIDRARQLGEPHDATVAGQICDVRFPHERKQVMLARAAEVDATDNNELFRLVLESPSEMPLGAVGNAGEQIAISPRDALGRVSKPVAVRVFADERETQFTLVEDDGETIDYLTGGAMAVRETPLTQQSTKAGCTVTLGPSTGTYAGAPDARPFLVHLVPPPGKTVATVEVDGGQIQEWKAGPYGVRIAGPAELVEAARTIRVTWKSDPP